MVKDEANQNLTSGDEKGHCYCLSGMGNLLCKLESSMFVVWWFLSPFFVVWMYVRLFSLIMSLLLTPNILLSVVLVLFSVVSAYLVCVVRVVLQFSIDKFSFTRLLSPLFFSLLCCLLIWVFGCRRCGFISSGKNSRGRRVQRNRYPTYHMMMSSHR